MKKLIGVVIILIIQQSTFNLQYSVAQTPFSTPDNVASGNCIQFDGISDYITISEDYNFTTDFTIEGWIRDLSGVHGVFLRIPAGQVSHATIDFSLSGTSKLIARNVYDPGGTDRSTPTSTTTVTTGEWYHFATTYDGLNHHLYVNGILEATVPHSGAVRASTTNQSYFGGGPGFGAPSSFGGMLDEIKFWNRALTQIEIKDNMSKSLQGNEAGLVGYWDFNEGTGSSIMDLTSNGNNGVLQ